MVIKNETLRLKNELNLFFQKNDNLSASEEETDSSAGGSGSSRQNSFQPLFNESFYQDKRRYSTVLSDPTAMASNDPNFVPVPLLPPPTQVVGLCGFTLTPCGRLGDFDLLNPHFSMGGLFQNGQNWSLIGELGLSIEVARMLGAAIYLPITANFRNQENTLSTQLNTDHYPSLQARFVPTGRKASISDEDKEDLRVADHPFGRTQISIGFERDLGLGKYRPTFLGNISLPEKPDELIPQFLHPKTKLDLTLTADFWRFLAGLSVFTSVDDQKNFRLGGSIALSFMADFYLHEKKSNFYLDAEAMYSAHFNNGGSDPEPTFLMLAAGPTWRDKFGFWNRLQFLYKRSFGGPLTPLYPSEEHYFGAQLEFRGRSSVLSTTGRGKPEIEPPYIRSDFFDWLDKKAQHFWGEVFYGDDPFLVPHPQSPDKAIMVDDKGKPIDKIGYRMFGDIRTLHAPWDPHGAPKQFACIGQNCYEEGTHFYYNPKDKKFRLHNGEEVANADQGYLPYDSRKNSIFHAADPVLEERNRQIRGCVSKNHDLPAGTTREKCYETVESDADIRKKIERKEKELQKEQDQGGQKEARREDKKKTQPKEDSRQAQKNVPSVQPTESSGNSVSSGSVVSSDPPVSPALSTTEHPAIVPGRVPVLVPVNSESSTPIFTVGSGVPARMSQDGARVIPDYPEITKRETWDKERNKKEEAGDSSIPYRDEEDRRRDVHRVERNSDTGSRENGSITTSEAKGKTIETEPDRSNSSSGFSNSAIGGQDRPADSPPLPATFPVLPTSGSLPVDQRKDSNQVSKAEPVYFPGTDLPYQLGKALLILPDNSNVGDYHQNKGKIRHEMLVRLANAQQNFVPQMMMEASEMLQHDLGIVSSQASKEDQKRGYEVFKGKFLALVNKVRSEHNSPNFHDSEALSKGKITEAIKQMLGNADREIPPEVIDEMFLTAKKSQSAGAYGHAYKNFEYGQLPYRLEALLENLYKLGQLQLGRYETVSKKVKARKTSGMRDEVLMSTLLEEFKLLDPKWVSHIASLAFADLPKGYEHLNPFPANQAFPPPINDGKRRSPAATGFTSDWNSDIRRKDDMEKLRGAGAFTMLNGMTVLSGGIGGGVIKAGTMLYSLYSGGKGLYVAYKNAQTVTAFYGAGLASEESKIHYLDNYQQALINTVAGQITRVELLRNSPELFRVLLTNGVQGILNTLTSKSAWKSESPVSILCENVLSSVTDGLMDYAFVKAGKWAVGGSNLILFPKNGNVVGGDGVLQTVLISNSGETTKLETRVKVEKESQGPTGNGLQLITLSGKQIQVALDKKAKLKLIRSVQYAPPPIAVFKKSEILNLHAGRQSGSSRKPNAVLVGNRIDDLKEAKRILDQITRGDPTSLEKLGIHEKFTRDEMRSITDGIEWAIGETATGQHVIVRGHFDKVPTLPGVRFRDHSHPGGVDRNAKQFPSYLTIGKVFSNKDQFPDVLRNMLPSLGDLQVIMRDFHSGEGKILHTLHTSHAIKQDGSLYLDLDGKGNRLKVDILDIKDDLIMKYSPNPSTAPSPLEVMKTTVSVKDSDGKELWKGDLLIDKPFSGLGVWNAAYHPAYSVIPSALKNSPGAPKL